MVYFLIAALFVTDLIAFGLISSISLETDAPIVLDIDVEKAKKKLNDIRKYSVYLYIVVTVNFAFVIALIDTFQKMLS